MEIANCVDQALEFARRKGEAVRQFACAKAFDLAAGELPHRFTLPAGELKRLIDKTQFAISTEETRCYLNGIYLHTLEAGGQTMLRAVATDGHRLARVEIRRRRGRRRCPG